MPIEYSQGGSALTLTVSGLSDELNLLSCRGEEGLSIPFKYTLDIEALEGALDFDAILGKAARITIDTVDTPRYINGVVTRFVQGRTSEAMTTYHAEVRPWFWLLTLTSDYKIFQELTVPAIVKLVFDSLGYASMNDYQDKTTGTYTAREFVVQYGETAFDFVSRLFEDEGIHYWFEHGDDGKHVLVFADDMDAHPALTSPSAVKCDFTQGSQDKHDVVSECHLDGRMTSTGTWLRDYNFKKPALLLESSATDGTAREDHYAFPGGFDVPADGDALARVRTEAHKLEKLVVFGASSVRGFSLGYTFTLTDHTRDSMNQKYLLRRVTHVAQEDHYGNQFEAIPAATPFRPARTTPKPVIHGAQTAIVVGPGGEEIWVDEHGRVKVQFHWDRLGKKDDKSSCWIRVAQGWAGAAWGTIFIPRVEQEVVVTFINGDPDRPLITGAVYHGTNVPPYALPANGTRSTIKSNTSKGGGGSNELRFEDKKDSEEVYIHAQKDLNAAIEHDRTQTVGNDDTLTVTKNRTVEVTEGDDSYTVTAGKRTLVVKAGDEKHTVGGKRGLDVTGEEKHTNADKFIHEVQGDYTLKISGKLIIEAEGSIAIKAGSTFDNEAGTALTNKAGSDLKNEATGGLTNKGATVDNKADTALTNKGATVTNDASGQLTNKAGGMQTVEAGGILTVKGSLVQIN